MKRSRSYISRRIRRFRLIPWVGFGLLTLALAVAASMSVGATSHNSARLAPETFAGVAAKVTPAVVNISTDWLVDENLAMGDQDGGRSSSPGSPGEEFFRRFFGENWPGFKDMHPRPGRMHALGSGFIISPDGYIATNNHVVEQAEHIEVRLSTGDTYKASLVGKDEATDLALLKIHAEKPLPHVKFGNSNQVRVGDWVMAVGNPFGLGGTVTVGVISARGRDIDGGSLVDFLQIDAPINRGSSGGPSFDLAGEVIGVNSSIYTPNGGNIGIGFAIPSSLAKSVIAELREHGAVERGWLGIRVQPVTPEIAEGLGLERPRGVLVVSVVPGGPAAKAGLRAGDIVLTWDGKEIDTFKDFPRLVANTGINKAVVISIQRGRADKTLRVTMGAMPSETKTAAAPQSASAVLEIPGTGVFLADLTPHVRKLYGIAEHVEGVVIVDVAEDSPALRQGLQEGDVITTVTLKPVQNIHDVEKLVERSREHGNPIAIFQVSRRNEQRFVALPIATS